MLGIFSQLRVKNRYRSGQVNNIIMVTYSPSVVFSKNLGRKKKNDYMYLVDGGKGEPKKLKVDKSAVAADDERGACLLVTRRRRAAAMVGLVEVFGRL